MALLPPGDHRAPKVVDHFFCQGRFLGGLDNGAKLGREFNIISAAHFGITQNQALEIALKHAGLSKAEVSYANVTQDFDNGMQRKIVLYIIFEKKITYYLVSWHNILCVLLEKQGESRQ